MAYFVDGKFVDAPPQTITIVPVRPPEPRIILAGWFKAAISQLGYTAAVAGAVSLQPEWKQILWNAATHIREDDADVIAIATALNINLSAVFDRAEEIRAAVRGEGV